MIKMIYDCNILDERDYSIVVPVNSVGVMGAGLAKAFRNKYPPVLDIYKKACKDKSILINGYMIIKMPNIPDVVLLTTKYHWAEDSSIDLIEHALERLEKNAISEGIHKIAIPKIGTGLGKLDWKKDVFPLIRKYFEKSKVEVLCYV